MSSIIYKRSPHSPMALAVTLALGCWPLGCGNKAPRESTTQGVMAALDNRAAATGTGTRTSGSGESTPSRAAPADLGAQHAGYLDATLEPPLDVVAPPDDARMSETGIYYKVVEQGSAQRSPEPDEIAYVHYTSWRTSGEPIYSTGKSGAPQPIAIALTSPGWRELLLDMRVGERRMVWMPSHLASNYKSSTQEVLVLLVDLERVEKAPETPENLRAPPADAETTGSGLAYQVLEPGDGEEAPTPWDRVGLQYTVWAEDGVMLETTLTRTTPQVVQPYRQPEGWSEAVQTLVEGRRARFWIPEDLRQPLGPGDPGGMQVVEMELVSLERVPAPPTVPDDVAAPPKNASKTQKGVYYVVLEPGTGTDHPTAKSRVKVHYTGWTTDGQMFDSSVVRGKPIVFPLDAVIEGWTDVLQVMVEGQKLRVWIPEALAYQGKPDRPQGMLVFEIHLLAIDPELDAAK